jgi:tRNA threonylcarbamoyladenosine biosynthesis protein TsaB
MLLAIETATTEVGVAIADASGVLAAVSVRTGRHHAEALHPAIEQVATLAGVTLGDLDAIAVDVGPGLFTGIRVGVAAAKGLAMALGVGIVASTSLEILAAAVRSAGGVPLPVVDLRRGEVAWAMPADGGSTSLGPEHGAPACLADRLAEALSVGGPRPFVLAGDGARRYAGELLARAGQAAVLGGVELAVPPVASLAVRALGELAAGRVVDPMWVEPVYLRDADTRINWSTRHDGPAGARAGG